MKKNTCLILIFFYTLSAFKPTVSSMQVDKLTCEYIKNPLGIDAKAPRLSWTLISEKRNQYQSAYELIVSDNLNDLKAGKGNSWTTGKIASSQTLHISYGGTALQSFTKYYWRVKVYNQDNEVSAWSEIANFETAMLEASDWQAKWISDGSRFPAKDEDYYKEDRMPLISKDFNASKKIIDARLYVSGVGYYEAFLNGKKIGDHVLDPGFTTYAKQVYYVVYDIGSLLKKGNNTAGIMLGSGWWNPLPFKLFGRWALKDYQQTGRPCVKAEIHIKYSDGSIEKIVTDESWHTVPGPITQNSVYLGEHYDARLEQNNWNLPNKERSSWANTIVVEGPSGKLSPQMLPAIKITKVIKPVSINEVGKDTFLVDMGQNFAGVVKLKVKGPAGTKITLRLGEDVFKDGRLNFMTSVITQIKKGGIKGGPGAPLTAWQEDGYTLKGEETETWSPRFTFHGFRYVEVTGWPGKPTIENFEGLRMNSDVQQSGSFECSNSMFNKLHDVIQWTFLSNIFSVQSDCPAREKMGYGGDIVATANSFIYNYDMANFYRKAVTDFANEQRPQGGITEIAPFTGIADRGYGDDSGPLGWQLAFPFVQKQLYDYYGDKAIIADNYDAFKKQIDFLQSKALNDGLFYWDIGDHEALDTKADAFSASSFYYHHLLLAASFAGILDRKDDSLKYAERAVRIKNTITRKYMLKGTGRFDNGTQAAQIFALYYGLSTEKENSIKSLMDEFARHNWHLSTGIFSTKMMFDVLRENNLNEIAYKIADQREFPGWGHMIQNGATTLWETWKYPGTGPSMNHPMFGSIEEWFYRSLLGINPASNAFEKIIIKPQPVSNLNFAKGTYESVRGKILSQWKTDQNGFNLSVTIPANTSAEIWLPATDQQTITERGKPVTGIKYEKGYAVTNIGSGNYQFLVSKN